MYTRMIALRPGAGTGDIEFTWATVLSDIWRKRRLVSAATVACLCIGVAYSLLRTPLYTVRSVAEIGSLPFDNSPAPVETADAVINKIKQVYSETAAQLPEVKKEFAGNIPATNVRSVRNTNAIIIETIADRQKANALIAFQNKLVELLRADHDKLFHVSVADLESQRNQARAEIERLKDPAASEAEARPVVASIEKLHNDIQMLRRDNSSSPQTIALDNAIAAAVSRLADLKDGDAMLERAIQQKEALAQQLKSQIANLTAHIKDSELGRDKIAASLPVNGERTSDDRTMMMSLLSFDSELNRKTIERDSLEQTLTVSLPLDRAKIESDRASNRRQIGLQENAILKFKADRRTIDQDRSERALALEQSLPALQAKLTDIQLTRKRLVAFQDARVTDITAKLKDVAGTRLLVEPRREAIESGAPASVIVPVAGVLGIAAGCMAALGMALMERYKDGIGEGMRKVAVSEPAPSHVTPEREKVVPVPAPYMPRKRQPRDVLNPLLTSFQIRPMPARKLGNDGPPR
jgi:hypothetical protein